MEDSKKATEDKLKKLETEMVEAKKSLESEVQTKKTLESELAQTKKSLETELAETKKSLEAELAETKKSLEAELAETKKSLTEAKTSLATMAAISSAIDNNSDTQSIGSTLSVSTKDVPASAEKDKTKEKEKVSSFLISNQGFDIANFPANRQTASLEMLFRRIFSPSN